MQNEKSQEFKLNVFVDESGQHDLEIEKEGASNLFICAAVIVDPYQMPEADAAMREISQKHFSGAEVKSSGVGSKHIRRSRILDDILKIDFGYYAIIIDKARIDRDSGLQYMPSFYKFLNRMLYQRISRSRVRMDILADEIRGKKFMDSIESYFAEYWLPDLFTVVSFSFGKSHQEPLIQLADFVAGSLSYCFDPDKRCEHSDKFRELLRAKEIGMNGWPPIRASRELEGSEVEYDIDRMISTSSINKANEFIKQFEEDPNNPDRRMQAAVLGHLLFVRQYETSVRHQFVYAEELINHLADLGFPALNKEQFRAKIIGPLRDEEIVLAGTWDGYKLAASSVDMIDYVKHVESIVIPMLKRLRKAQTTVKMATANRHDIIGSPEFGDLKSIIDAYVDNEICPTAYRVECAEE